MFYYFKYDLKKLNFLCLIILIMSEVLSFEKFMKRYPNERDFNTDSSRQILSQIYNNYKDEIESIAHPDYSNISLYFANFMFHLRAEEMVISYTRLGRSESKI